MKRWNCKTGENAEFSKIDAFLADIEKVCKAHNMSISHEDCHGAFQIEKFDIDNIDWLKVADNNLGE